MSVQYTSLNTLKYLVANISDNYVKKSDVSTYSIVKKETADTGFAASYQLTVGGVATGDTINIPKDYLVKSCDIKVCSEADKPVAGYVVGDKYVDFVVNTVGTDGDESHIYLKVQELVDVYKSSKSVTVGTDNTISIKIDTTNANGLSVGDDGVKLALATTTTPGAMSSADKVKVDAALTSDDFSEITKEEVDKLFTTSTTTEG